MIKKIYSLLRGFNLLKNNNKLGMWESIRFDLLKTSQLVMNIFQSFFGISYKNAGIAIHQ